MTGTVVAQKMHAPKGVWKAMVANLNDIQSITGALAVFDMERATTIADGLVKRETFISKMEQLPEAVRKGHAKVADAATELAAATRSGDEQEISMKSAQYWRLVVPAITTCGTPNGAKSWNKLPRQTAVEPGPCSQCQVLVPRFPGGAFD